MRCLRLAVLTMLLQPAALVTVHAAEEAIPGWCRSLPRAEYKSIPRVAVMDSWFEVYQPAPGVLAIYEPHQSEETISYLITGTKRAVLFDTGMGISDLKRIVDQLTRLPVVVLNSHSHNDHVGSNWQFQTVFGMDSPFTRERSRGSREAAQAEIQPGEICGALPEGFDRTSYATRPWRIAGIRKAGDRIDLGGRSVEILATPGHTPDAISLIDRDHGLLFTGDTFYPGPIWLFRPETDLAAYEASIRQLAALAPRLKLVLGAHNVPAAAPRVLPELLAAFLAVREGKIVPASESGAKVVYKTAGFSFLMAPAASRR